MVYLIDPTHPIQRLRHAQRCELVVGPRGDVDDGDDVGGLLEKLVRQHIDQIRTPEREVETGG